MGMQIKFVGDMACILSVGLQSARCMAKTRHSTRISPPHACLNCRAMGMPRPTLLLRERLRELATLVQETWESRAGPAGR